MKRVNFVDQGADRHVAGRVECFDQKNEMFKRCRWESEVKHLGRRFYHDEIPPRDKPGYMLKDQSLVNASWRLENEFARGVLGGRMGLYNWNWDGRFDYPRPPAGLKIDGDNPVVLTREVKKAAALFGADLVGVCRLDRRWLYSPAYLITPDGGEETEIEIPEDYQYAVALAVAMDYESIRYSPAHPASAATGVGYSRMAFVAGLLALFIRGLGFRAIPCGNDTACSIPIAMDAGLGELGRNGLLVTPEFGPRVRLAKVFTDLPLVPDRPVEFGVWDFCIRCGKCADQCPSQAIMHGDPTERPNNKSNREGVLRWPINAEECVAFWVANGTDCSNCIRTCPFNKPAGLLHDTVRWGVKNLRWLDPFFLWMDDLFGYGTRAGAGRFWET